MDNMLYIAAFIGGLYSLKNIQHLLFDQKHKIFLWTN